MFDHTHQKLSENDIYLTKKHKAVNCLTHFILGRILSRLTSNLDIKILSKISSNLHEAVPPILFQTI